MRKIKEVLRLHYECKLNLSEIGRSCSLSHTAVSDCLKRSESNGITWPLSKDLDDESLECLLYKKDARWRRETLSLPNWSDIHKEMRKSHVTRQLLWEEYKEANPNGVGYSQFCNYYRDWLKTSEPSLRQVHKAGEKLFVDYAGKTVPIHDHITGEIRQAQIFVAVLGASNFTYAEATFSQATHDWVSSHVRAFEYFGGTSYVVVPDNLKSAVTKTCRYEPEINKTYNDLAIHYGVAVVPARVRKPKDKSKAENGVLLVERWILAALRNETFTSLGELNQKIKKLLDLLNSKPFQKMDGSRRSLFEEVEKPALKPLPKTSYQYAEFKLARVNIDYHVEYEGHYYSVPYSYIRKQVELRITGNTLEVFHHGKRLASHPRNRKKGMHTTVTEHMPKSHQKYVEWTPDRVVNWAKSIGDKTAQLVNHILKSRAHPQQGFRSCMGVIRLGKIYGNDRLEAACQRALEIKSCSFKSVKSILQTGLDKTSLTKQEEFKPINHTNIRGEEILH